MNTLHPFYSFTLLTLLSSLLFSTPSLFAQSTEEKILAPVVVTASRISEEQRHTLLHTTVITRQNIIDSQATGLINLLRQEAGIELAQGGGAGATSSLFMRGTAPGQTLFLIDGIPVRRQNLSNAPAIEHILPDQIDHIEIIRGNASAIYGSGAVGGVIQIFTKRGSGPVQINTLGEIGSRGTFKISSNISGKHEDTRYALSISRFKTDNFNASDRMRYPNENPDKDGNNNTSFNLSASKEWEKNQEIGFYTTQNKGRYGYDGDGYGAIDDRNIGNSLQRINALYTKNKFTPSWLSKITLSQTSTDNSTNSSTNLGENKNRYRDQTHLLQWENHIILNDDWTLTAGTDFAKEKIKVESFSSIDYGYGAAGFSKSQYDRSTFDAYAGLNGKFNDHQFQFNLRHDQVQGSGSDNTAYIGYGLLLIPTFKLIMNASTAFHAPTLVQFYDPNYGNPNLKAERAKSFEIGGQYFQDNRLFRLTFFSTKTKDQFGYDPSTYRTININRTRNQGVEISSTTNLFNFDIKFSLTLQNPKDERPGEVLIRRAKTLASISAYENSGAYRTGLSLNYTGPRPDKDFGNYPATLVNLPSYTLLNLYGRYQYNKEISLFWRIENVYNRHYQTVYGTNQAGRGIFVGVQWTQ